MSKYNYIESMKDNIMDIIRDDYNTTDFSSREEFETTLFDDLWTNDNVTGNGSGSYTFNRNQAKEYVEDNIELLQDACKEFCVESETIVEKFFNEDWEYFDVTIRCYLLNQAISELLNELEEQEYLIFND